MADGQQGFSFREQNFGTNSRLRWNWETAYWLLDKLFIYFLDYLVTYLLCLSMQLTFFFIFHYLAIVNSFVKFHGIFCKFRGPLEKTATGKGMPSLAFLRMNNNNSSNSWQRFQLTINFTLIATYSNPRPYRTASTTTDFPDRYSTAHGQYTHTTWMWMTTTRKSPQLGLCLRGGKVVSEESCGTISKSLFHASCYQNQMDNVCAGKEWCF